MKTRQVIPQKHFLFIHKIKGIRRKNTRMTRTTNWQYRSDNIIATESTEEHEKIPCNAFIFPCSSMDSVAIIELPVN